MKKRCILLLTILTILLTYGCSRIISDNFDSETSIPEKSPTAKDINGITQMPTPIETNETTQSPTSDESSINGFHPIISFNYFRAEEYSSALILGGSFDGEFFTYDDYIEENMGNGENLIKIDEKFDCYGSEGFIAKTNCIDVEVEYGDHFFYPMVKFDYFKTESDIPIIGISCDWDAMPRIPTQISENELMIDFDGDGIEEKIANILCGDFIDEYGMKKNQYKISVMRKESVLCELDLDMYEDQTFWYYFLDLNGDNKLEMIYMSQFPHEYYFYAYEIKENKFVKIFEYSGGD